MSTRKKASRSSMKKSLRKSEPPLVHAYRAAIMTVCGQRFFKSREKDHPRFKARQTQLDILGAAYDTYSYTVVKSWWQWCQTQGMGSVPVNLFLGKKAWGRFLKVHNSSVKLTTVEDDTWNAAVHTEITAARAFIGGTLNGRMVTLRGIRRRLKEPDPHKEVIAEALRLLNLALGTDAENYNGVYLVLKARQDARSLRIQTI